MTIQFATNLSSKDTLTLIPVAQVEKQAPAKVLAEVAKTYQQDAAGLQHIFQAAASEFCYQHTPQGDYLLIGLGADPSFPQVLKVFRQLALKQAKYLRPKIQLSLLFENHPADLDRVIEAITNGLGQGRYEIGKYKSAAQPETKPFPDTLLFGVNQPESSSLSKTAQRGWTIADVQCRIMDLVNAPSNKKVPQDLAAWATASAASYGYQAEVWDKDQITAAGMGGLLAVNQGSPTPPAFIILEYRGPNAPDYKVGLVGKGVTFDTGGLSIKPANNMHYMKSDMGGAAAVLGTFEAAARLQLPVHLVGAIPSTDNSVAATAVKPSDVISSYSGQTIEVIDTDAEGRLILADGLAYLIEQQQPDVLIDLATLTGSSVRTLGYLAGALFSHNDELASALETSGQATGERLWRLPLWEEYGEEMKSDVADIKNFSGRPTAGAITAAKFLEFFVSQHPAWAHLDIAGVAFGDTDYASGKAATGYGIRLLVDYLSKH
jgi:leucyl aminopeptidase